MSRLCSYPSCRNPAAWLNKNHHWRYLCTDHARVLYHAGSANLFPIPDSEFPSPPPLPANEALAIENALEHQAFCAFIDALRRAGWRVIPPGSVGAYAKPAEHWHSPVTYDKPCHTQASASPLNDYEAPALEKPTCCTQRPDPAE